MDFLKQAEKALSSDAGKSALKFLDSEKGSQVIDQVSHTVAPKAQADMAASALKGYVHSHNQSAGGGAIQQPQQQQQISGQSEGQGHFVEPSGPPPSGAGAPAQGHAAAAAGGNPLMDLAAGFLKR